MEPLELYKSIYEREQGRRYTLESATNLPITICSIVIALLYFLINSVNAKNPLLLNTALIAVAAIVFILFTISLYFLAKAYNNLFKGFGYCDFPSPKELHRYQLQLEAYNQQVAEPEQRSFNDYLLRNYVDCADSSTRFNDLRSFSLHKAKTFIITSIFIEVLALTFFLIPKINSAMSDNNNDSAKPVQTTTPPPKPPTEPTNRIVKGGLSDDRPKPSTSSPDIKKQ